MKTAPTKEFFYEHFIKQQQWTTTVDQVDYRTEIDGYTLRIILQQSQGPECYNGRKDWIRNLRCRPSYEKDYFKSLFHKGFLTAFDNLYGKIISNVRDLYSHGKIKIIEITAYSQGCGIGFILYAYLLVYCRYDFLTIKDPIFFAPPAIVWFWLSWRMHKYLKNVRLVRTRKDIVPKILKWLGYRHIGKTEYLDEPKGYQHPASIPEWMQKTYHYPEYYMACLPGESEVKEC